VQAKKTSAEFQYKMHGSTMPSGIHCPTVSYGTQSASCKAPHHAHRWRHACYF